MCAKQVPVHADYSDLYNILAFFDGGLDEEKRSGNHDELAEEIALAGRDWAERHWREVDMRACEFFCYTFSRLLGVATDETSDGAQNRCVPALAGVC